jgi:hypothetical protein
MMKRKSLLVFLIAASLVIALASCQKGEPAKAAGARSGGEDRLESSATAPERSLADFHDNACKEITQARRQARSETLVGGSVFRLTRNSTRSMKRPADGLHLPMYSLDKWPAAGLITPGPARSRAKPSGLGSTMRAVRTSEQIWKATT